MTQAFFASRFAKVKMYHQDVVGIRIKQIFMISIGILGLFFGQITLSGSSYAQIPVGGKQTHLDHTPVLVELFTSQGCISCPPADDFLAELSTRPDVVVLSLHVDYWDYIGWKDPFSKTAFSERQRHYARLLGKRMVYTPQMVINGRSEVVGSHRGAVQKAIEAAREKMSQQKLALLISQDQDQWHAHIRPMRPYDFGSGPVLLRLALYEDTTATDVRRGENRNRHLKNTHVVRDLKTVGQWRGGDLDVPLPLSQKDLAPLAGSKSQLGIALFLQQSQGQVIAATHSLM